MNLLQGNWVDLVIIFIVIFFLSEAITLGFWIILVDFVSFLGSLLISLRGYQFASSILRQNFSLSHSISNALGFLFTAVLSEAILSIALIRLVKKLPDKYLHAKWNKALSLLPAFGQAIIIISFILTLVIALPIRPKIKADVERSRIASFLIQRTAGIEKILNEVFGGVIEDSLTHLTIKPGSRESVPLEVEKHELSVDSASEAEMLNLVNQERRKRGVSELTLRQEVLPIARAHAKDMWEREYFSHVSPEGKDVGDRLDEAGIRYRIAGENLALAPTLSTAHTGLMNSEGHKANILEPKFKRVGIGVIDNGVYGKMFVQVFTD